MHRARLLPSGGMMGDQLRKWDELEHRLHHFCSTEKSKFQKCSFFVHTQIWESFFTVFYNMQFTCIHAYIFVFCVWVWMFIICTFWMQYTIITHLHNCSNRKILRNQWKFVYTIHLALSNWNNRNKFRK